MRWSEITEAAEASEQSNTAEFRSWFGRSKVVDKDGSPLLCHHGTTKKFDRFTPLSHFGTFEAAHERLYFKARNHFQDLRKRGFDKVNPAPKGARIIGAYLRIEKPLTIVDDANGDVRSFIRRIGEAMLANGWDEREITAMTQPKDPMPLIEALRQRKYDGFAYTNTWEDAGSTSWVVFDADQVWQVNAAPHAW